MKELKQEKSEILKEVSKCRACRFCVDVCPTYSVEHGLESLSSYGRIQTLIYLLNGTLDFDDALSYTLYTCLQCRRCENICKSKGQDIEISKAIQRGRTILSQELAEGTSNETN